MQSIRHKTIHMCTIKIRHKHRCVKFRFFVVPCDCPELLGIPAIELPSLLKITCGIISGPPESKKFYSQTMEMSDSPNCRTKKDLQVNEDREDVYDGKRKIPDYFKSSANRVADKRTGEVLTNKIHKSQVIFFQ